MNTLWILIVVTHVQYGAVTSFQEFNTFEACKNAQGVVNAGVGRVGGLGSNDSTLFSMCVSKGEVKK